MIGVTLCLNGIFFPQNSRICCFFSYPFWWCQWCDCECCNKYVTVYLCSLRSFWFTECIIGSVLQHKKWVCIHLHSVFVFAALACLVIDYFAEILLCFAKNVVIIGHWILWFLTAVLMDEPVSEYQSLDPVSHSDSACALVELNPSAPEHFVRKWQVLPRIIIQFNSV